MIIMSIKYVNAIFETMTQPMMPKATNEIRRQLKKLIKRPKKGDAYNRI